MKIQSQYFTCTDCRHVWIGELVVDAPVELFIASMKAVRCPHCGSKGVGLGRGHVPEPAPNTSDISDSERRAQWLNLYDNGLSSECIADVMCGSPTKGNYPLDGDDFGRCERLLILYPAWRERFCEMAAVNPHWAALVPRWSEIAEAWRTDVAAQQAGMRNARQCNPLMRSILDPVTESMTMQKG